MAFPADYWESYEHPIATVTEFQDAIRMISAYQSATGSRFVWRGAADADWPLYSSLVRAYKNIHGTTPMEPSYATSNGD